MKYKHKPVRLLFLLFAAPALIYAQQPRKTLHLNEAIELGLNHSKDLKVSSQQIEEAAAVYNQATNNRLPDVKLSGAYMYLVKPNINLLIGKDNSSDEGSSGEGDNSGTTFPNVHQALYGMLNASLPLYAGGQISNGIKSAGYLASAAKLDAENQKEEVVQNIISAYYNLYKADAALRLVNENLVTAQQRVKDFMNLEANGIIARNDLMKAELQESNVELALLDAENNRKISNFNFNLMLGLDDSTKIEIDSTQIFSEPVIQNMGELLSMARSNRFDYLAVIERQKAAGFQTRAVKGAQYPSLALTGGYVAADIPKALTAYNVVNIGLGLSYDLGALYKNNAKVRQAKTRENILQIQQQKLDDDIQTQIFQAYNDYLHEVKKTDVYKKAIDQAEENYRITKNKYDNALATATDLLDADVALLQAKINYEYTRADAAVAYNKIYETVGVLNKKVNKSIQ